MTDKANSCSPFLIDIGDHHNKQQGADGNAVSPGKEKLMTEEMLGVLLPRLERALHLEEPDEELTILLEDELCDAEGELLLYLGDSELKEVMMPKVVELAAVFYRRDCAEHAALRGVSYAEGQLSQSETYLTPEDYYSAVQEIVSSLARYRRVSCR